MEEEEEEEEEEEDEEEDEDNEMEIQKQGKDELPEKSQFADGSGEEPNQQPQPVISENANIRIHIQKDALVLQEEETMAVQQNKRKLQELQEREEKVKVFKKFYIENPLLLSLCGTLFPDNQRSVWSGPHSLVQHQDSGHTSSIHAAIETFMK